MVPGIVSREGMIEVSRLIAMITSTMADIINSKRFPPKVPRDNIQPHVSSAITEGRSICAFFLHPGFSDVVSIEGSSVCPVKRDCRLSCFALIC